MFSGIRGTNYVREVGIGVACIWVVSVCNVGPGPTYLTAFCGFPHSGTLQINGHRLTG